YVHFGRRKTCLLIRKGKQKRSPLFSCCTPEAVTSGDAPQLEEGRQHCTRRDNLRLFFQGKDTRQVRRIKHVEYAFHDSAILLFLRSQGSEDFASSFAIGRRDGIIAPAPLRH